MMTREEGGFEVAPAPRVFERTKWDCENCDVVGWSWVEVGAQPRTDRCPHRRAPTVKPIVRR
jgi:hypothetical protein